MSETNHISLSGLLSSVSRALADAFPAPVWVTADIADLKVNPSSGHCYLELVEKGADNAVPRASARAVAWRGNWQSLSAYFLGITGSGLAPGMKVLVKVTVSYHELYGFSLQITDIDPSYTLGESERQRRETIARLQKDGVWDMNREVDFPPVVQRVAVISSASAAGWRDFLQELERYPCRFHISLFEATMQGHATEDSVIAALEAIASQVDDFDAVVIIRGGGSQSDLSAFDGYRLCSHIAQFPLPVITGIGHDKDRSVADMVAALELKTPTAVAVWLGEGLTSFVRLLDTLNDRLSTAATTFLERERLRLERLGRIASSSAVDMTRGLELRLERLSADLSRKSGELFLRETHRLATFGASLRERPAMLLSRQTERLTAFENLIALRRPENILALGFAIVRPILPGGKGGPDSPGSETLGRAVTDPSALTPDTPLSITLSRGTLRAKTIK